MSTIASLSRFICQTTYNDLPRDAIDCAKERILDTIGVILSGYKHEFHKPMWDALKGHPGKREATVLGEGVRVNCALAAFVNSALCDGMSDGSRFAGLHPSVIVIPSALASIETESQRRSVGGRDLLLATVLGYEVMIRIGRAMMPSSVLRGFHPTSVIGPLGAASVACKVFRLSETLTSNALSIAALLGGGLVEAFNAPRTYVQIQEARATESGMLAAFFAQNGAPGKEDILDNAFLSAFSDEHRAASITHELGKDYGIGKTYIIMHYGCRHLHAPIDAAVHVIRRNNVVPSEIERIKVKTYRVAAELGIDVPNNADEAGSSIPFGIAVALIYGDASQDKFTPRYFEDRRVVDLIRRINVEHDPSLDRDYPAKRGTEVELVTRSGQSFACKLDLARGEPETPFTRVEIEEKFDRMTSGLIAKDTKQEVLRLIDRLDDVKDVAELIECLRSATRPRLR